MDEMRAVPRTAKGRPSTVSASDFRYRFGSRPRRMGDGFTVAEARRRLLGFYRGHLTFVRSVAAWIISIPEFEVKIEVSHHLYSHAEAARLLRTRLLELGATAAELGRIPEPWSVIREEVLHARSAAEFLSGLHTAITPLLVEAEERYCGETDSLLDLPSIRILRLVRPEIEESVRWGESAVAAYLVGGEAGASVAAWRDHVRRLISATGVFAGDRAGASLPPLRQETEPPFQRAIACERDARFTTFHHTRDYRRADAVGVNTDDEYAAWRLELVRVQRDELDAIETFANVLFDLPDPEFDLQMDLARFIWDEARHAEIGQQELSRLGFAPFDVPCGIIGINVRSPLPPSIALAQISTFGELNIVGPMRRLGDAARERGDRQTEITFDFIHRDELFHLRRGRHWLSRLHPSGDMAALAEEARVQAIHRLVEEGVVGEEYASNLTTDDIAALLGGE